MHKLILLLTVMLCWLLFTQHASAITDQQLQNDLSQINSRLDRMENDLSEAGTGGGVLFLFGAFCALWAQNTKRNAWLWFFLGMLFNIITIFVLLSKNSNDRKREMLGVAL